MLRSSDCVSWVHRKNNYKTKNHFRKCVANSARSQKMLWAAEIVKRMSLPSLQLYTFLKRFMQNTPDDFKWIAKLVISVFDSSLWLMCLLLVTTEKNCCSNCHDSPSPILSGAPRSLVPPTASPSRVCCEQLQPSPRFPSGWKYWETVSIRSEGKTAVAPS